MHDLVTALGLLRGPIVVVVLTAIILVVPSQSYEVFTVIGEGTGRRWFVDVARIAGGAILLAGAILVAGVTLVAGCPPSRKDACDRYDDLIESTALALPVVTLFVTLLAASGSKWWQFSDMIEFDRPTAIILAANGMLAITIAAGIWLPDARRAAVNTVIGFMQPMRRLSVPAALSLWIGAFGLCSAAAVYAPFRTAELAGPVLTIFVFLTLAVTGGALLTYVFDKHQIPVLTMLAVAALMWSALGWSNNHQFRLLKNPEHEKSLDASKSFQLWLEARPDLNDYADKHYPVYIVTAEGGGMYAAAHVASALARLQDGCARFAPHVFAISSVSGGSLGAAVFAGLIDAIGPRVGEPLSVDCALRADGDGPMQRAVQNFFRRDLLTPLLAATLFPDTLQRFLPTPIGDFDRARALEVSFEAAWQRTLTDIGREATDNFFKRATHKTWDPKGHAPAVLLNSTVIQYGDRLVMAPFKLASPEEKLQAFADRRVDDLNGEFGVRVSTAVAASARFPFVTPPALHSYQVKADPNPYQVVDGGYYDNSGIRTAVDLIARVRQQEEQSLSMSVEQADRPAVSQCASSSELGVHTTFGLRWVCFKIIVIKGRQTLVKKRVYGELLSPMLALLEARVGLGRGNMEAVRRTYCRSVQCAEDDEVSDEHLYEKQIDTEGLALGWYLSRRSFEQIARVDYGMECRPGGVSKEQLPALQYACLRTKVARDLQVVGR